MIPISRLSVRTFLICLVLACLLPGVIGAAILFMFEYKNGREQLEKDTLQTARALSQAVDSHLLRALAVAQSLSTADSLARHDLPTFQRRARETIELSGLGTNVVLRDRQGRQLLNTAIPSGKPLLADPAPEQVRAVFEHGKPTFSDVFFGPVMKRPVISVDVPVWVDGKIAYALGVGILPGHFNSILNNQQLPSGWVAGVLDRNLTIAGRTRNPEQYVGQKPSDNLIAAIEKFGQGTTETRSMEGITVASFFVRSPVTKWSVAIGIPYKSLEFPLLRTLAILALGITLLFGIGLTLAWLIGGRIACAFQLLTTPALALGQGRQDNLQELPELHVKEAAELALAMHSAGKLLKERAAVLALRETELAEAHRLARLGTWHWNLETCELITSESVREIYGGAVLPFEQQRGTLMNGDDWDNVRSAMQAVLRDGTGYDLELQINHANGAMAWINAKCRAIHDESGHVVALRGAVQDITERKLAELRERDAALHDALTGLPNRAFVFEYGSHLLAGAQRGHGRGALLFIDLDRFKPINDLYGHETGDRVLQEVARRLTGCTRNEDMVGRLGGDEFVIILPHVAGDRSRAATVARHVIDSISRPVQIDHLEVSVSPSIGISYFPAHACDVGTLIHTADLAMYQAKQWGRGNYQFYTPELDQRANEALAIETRLKIALKHDGLELHYQPVINVDSGELIGAEALVRLKDSGGEAIGPGSFIPIAESTGLIVELGDWVAAEACRQQARWRSVGLKINMAINVSPLQFRQRGFTEKLRRIIAETGIDPSCLEIEVTESMLMETVDDAIEILKRIKSLGVKIALDDFGTGYSSLSSLISLPIDKLKVDQSFVRRIEHDPASRAVTEAIIALGHSLKLDVHGEGIESEIASAYLREHGCDQAQGFWFSKPLPASEFLQWCRQQAAEPASGVSA